MAKRPGELTDKQERFCLNLVSGMSQREAFLQAGYSQGMAPATVDVKASQLAAADKIKIRLAELRQAAVDKTIMSVVERKQRLSEAGRADITDFIDSEGVPILTADTANHRAVTEYIVSERYTKLGERIVKTRIKLSDPVSNIAELNKMDGVYDTKTTINNININAVQIEDAKADGKFREVIDATELKSEGQNN